MCAFMLEVTDVLSFPFFTDDVLVANLLRFHYLEPYNSHTKTITMTVTVTVTVTLTIT